MRIVFERSSIEMHVKTLWVRHSEDLVVQSQRFRPMSSGVKITCFLFFYFNKKLYEKNCMKITFFVYFSSFFNQYLAFYYLNS